MSRSRTAPSAPSSTLGREVQLCRFLRNKALRGSWEGAEDLAVLYTWNECPWECLQTAEPWGADGDLVVPEACHDGRACFQPSPRLPRRSGQA
jgi:hypothetical protein